MDKEQEEMQFLGFFGIFNESFKIISSYRKILTQITLAIILPLSFIFLAHIEISEYIFGEIQHNEQALDRTREGTTTYSKLSDIISSEWITFCLFKIVYLIFFLVLSLLSTSATVYTVACIYTSKEITFKKVMSVVPKVWKRLMVTFIWNFIIVFAFNVAALLALFIIYVLVGPTVFGLVILIIFSIIYFMIFVCITVVWHLASVISVLEDVYGIQAMLKSKDLIRGKIGVAIFIFLLLSLCSFGINLGFETYVALAIHDTFGVRVMYAMFFFLLLSILTLFGLVIQTVIYFVCKSYHHENIDKSSLADHLEVYLGDYVPLKSKDLQLEHFDL